jgi:hypothetical protein
MRVREQPGPVVACASGLAGSWRIPFVRQIRSDSTSAAHDLPNQPVPRAAVGPRLGVHPQASPHWHAAQRGVAKAPQLV